MKRRAFTLIELLVVIAIIGLLTTIAVTSFSTTQMNARNTRRKTDLVQISKALELYYDNNNHYPVTGVADWWGTCSSAHGMGADAWIPGLVSGGYMQHLPSDPTNLVSHQPHSGCGSAWACYLYRSDVGTDYKVAACCTPEGTIQANDPFYDGSNDWRFAVWSPNAKSW